VLSTSSNCCDLNGRLTSLVHTPAGREESRAVSNIKCDTANLEGFRSFSAGTAIHLEFIGRIASDPKKSPGMPQPRVSHLEMEPASPDLDHTGVFITQVLPD
jgi:hypothetical protein